MYNLKGKQIDRYEGNIKINLLEIFSEMWTGLTGPMIGDNSVDDNFRNQMDKRLLLMKNVVLCGLFLAAP
jgi:hypothetical protein